MEKILYDDNKIIFRHGIDSKWVELSQPQHPHGLNGHINHEGLFLDYSILMFYSFRYIHKRSHGKHKNGYLKRKIDDFTFLDSNITLEQLARYMTLSHLVTCPISSLHHVTWMQGLIHSTTGLIDYVM